jgi:hypothetical protein
MNPEKDACFSFSQHHYSRLSYSDVGKLPLHLITEYLRRAKIKDLGRFEDAEKIISSLHSNFKQEIKRLTGPRFEIKMICLARNTDCCTNALKVYGYDIRWGWRSDWSNFELRRGVPLGNLGSKETKEFSSGDLLDVLAWQCCIEYLNDLNYEFVRETSKRLEFEIDAREGNFHRWAESVGYSVSLHNSAVWWCKEAEHHHLEHPCFEHAIDGRRLLGSEFHSRRCNVSIPNYRSRSMAISRKKTGSYVYYVPDPSQFISGSLYENREPDPSLPWFSQYTLPLIRNAKDGSLQLKEQSEFLKKNALYNYGRFLSSKTHHLLVITASPTELRKQLHGEYFESLDFLKPFRLHSLYPPAYYAFTRKSQPDIELDCLGRYSCPWTLKPNESSILHEHQEKDLANYFRDLKKSGLRVGQISQQPFASEFVLGTAFMGTPNEYHLAHLIFEGNDIKTAYKMRHELRSFCIQFQNHRHVTGDLRSHHRGTNRGIRLEGPLKGLNAFGQIQVSLLADVDCKVDFESPPSEDHLNLVRLLNLSNLQEEEGRLDWQSMLKSREFYLPYEYHVLCRGPITSQELGLSEDHIWDMGILYGDNKIYLNIGSLAASLSFVGWKRGVASNYAALSGTRDLLKASGMLTVLPSESKDLVAGDDAVRFGQFCPDVFDLRSSNWHRPWELELWIKRMHEASFGWWESFLKDSWSKWYSLLLEDPSLKVECKRANELCLVSLANDTGSSIESPYSDCCLKFPHFNVSGRPLFKFPLQYACLSEFENRSNVENFNQSSSHAISCNIEFHVNFLKSENAPLDEEQEEQLAKLRSEIPEGTESSGNSSDLSHLLPVYIRCDANPNFPANRRRTCQRWSHGKEKKIKQDEFSYRYTDKVSMHLLRQLKSSIPHKSGAEGDGKCQLAFFRKLALSLDTYKNLFGALFQSDDYWIRKCMLLLSDDCHDQVVEQLREKNFDWGGSSWKDAQYRRLCYNSYHRSSENTLAYLHNALGAYHAFLTNGWAASLTDRDVASHPKNDTSVATKEKEGAAGGDNNPGTRLSKNYPFRLGSTWPKAFELPDQGDRKSQGVNVEKRIVEPSKNRLLSLEEIGYFLVPVSFRTAFPAMVNSPLCQRTEVGGLGYVYDMFVNKLPPASFFSPRDLEISEANRRTTDVNEFLGYVANQLKKHWISRGYCGIFASSVVCNKEDSRNIPCVTSFKDEPNGRYKGSWVCECAQCCTVYDDICTEFGCWYSLQDSKTGKRYLSHILGSMIMKSEQPNGTKNEELKNAEEAFAKSFFDDFYFSKTDVLEHLRGPYNESSENVRATVGKMLATSSSTGIPVVEIANEINWERCKWHYFTLLEASIQIAIHHQKTLKLLSPFRCALDCGLQKNNGPVEENFEGHLVFVYDKEEVRHGHLIKTRWAEHLNVSPPQAKHRTIDSNLPTIPCKMKYKHTQQSPFRVFSETSPEFIRRGKTCHDEETALLSSLALSLLYDISLMDGALSPMFGRTFDVHAFSKKNTRKEGREDPTAFFGPDVSVESSPAYRFALKTVIWLTELTFIEEQSNQTCRKDHLSYLPIHRSELTKGETCLEHETFSITNDISNKWEDIGPTSKLPSNVKYLDRLNQMFPATRLTVMALIFRLYFYVRKELNELLELWEKELAGLTGNEEHEHVNGRCGSVEKAAAAFQILFGICTKFSQHQAPSDASGLASNEVSGLGSGYYVTHKTGLLPPFLADSGCDCKWDDNVAENSTLADEPLLKVFVKTKKCPCTSSNPLTSVKKLSVRTANNGDANEVDHLYLKLGEIAFHQLQRERKQTEEAKEQRLQQLRTQRPAPSVVDAVGKKRNRDGRTSAQLDPKKFKKEAQKKLRLKEATKMRRDQLYDNKLWLSKTLVERDQRPSFEYEDSNKCSVDVLFVHLYFRSMAELEKNCGCCKTPGGCSSNDKPCPSGTNPCEKITSVAWMDCRIPHSPLRYTISPEEFLSTHLSSVVQPFVY